MTKLGELRAFLGLFALSHLACRRSIGSIPFQGYISLPMPPLRTVLEMRRISFSSSGINISSSPSREMPEMALALTPPPPPPSPSILPPPPPSVCDTDFQAPLSHTELNGPGVGSPTSMPAEDCCKACMNQAGCAGFVVFGSTCYLKGGPLTTHALSDRTAYLRIMPPPPALPQPSQPPPLPPPSVCDTEFQAPLSDTELMGPGVGSPASMPAENCCEACVNQAGCAGFVVFGSCL